MVAQRCEQTRHLIVHFKGMNVWYVNSLKEAFKSLMPNERPLGALRCPKLVTAHFYFWRLR